MPPRILVSAATAKPDAALNYENAIRAAGFDFVTRYCPEVDLSFDGLLLTGGGDVAPHLYGQENRGSMPPDPDRDRTELALAHAYLAAGKPILGICRGTQVLNVALGGTLVQDLGEELNLFHRRNQHNAGNRRHLLHSNGPRWKVAYIYRLFLDRHVSELPQSPLYN